MRARVHSNMRGVRAPCVRICVLAYVRTCVRVVACASVRRPVRVRERRGVCLHLSAGARIFCMSGPPVVSGRQSMLVTST